MRGGEDVDADVGHVKKSRQYGRGHAHRQQGLNAGTVQRPGLPGIEAQRGLLRRPAIGPQQIQARDAVGQRGGKRRAGDLLPLRQQHEHEQRVQRAVQYAAHAQAHAGLAGIACVAQQVGQRQRQYAGQAADHGDDDGVAAGIPPGGLRRAQEFQDRVQKHADQQRIGQGDRGRAVQREGAHPPRTVRLPRPHQPRHQTAAADAEQVRQRHVHHHHRQRQRRGRHHVGVARPADEEGVHHVVDQVDHLADDRRHRHRPERPRHRHRGEQLLLAGLLLAHVQSFFPVRYSHCNTHRLSGHFRPP